MSLNFEQFLALNLQVIPLSTQEFVSSSKQFLKQQLDDYLQSIALHNHSLNNQSFSKTVKTAQKLQDDETHKSFWLALLAFEKASTNKSNSAREYLKFINIIEHLQGYAGSQVFAIKSIKAKQEKRLVLATMLAWEHLRYLAGNDDSFSPSEQILSVFTDIDDHHHDNEQSHEHNCSDDNCGHSH